MRALSQDEIYDMVKPAQPLHITLQDLITRCVYMSIMTRGLYTPTNSGQGETVVGILTDLSGFWAYENREVLLAENQEGGAG